MNTIQFTKTNKFSLKRPSSEYAEAALLKMRQMHESRAWQPMHFRDNQKLKQSIISIARYDPILENDISCLPVQV